MEKLSICPWRTYHLAVLSTCRGLINEYKTAKLYPVYLNSIIEFCNNCEIIYWNLCKIGASYDLVYIWINNNEKYILGLPKFLKVLSKYDNLISKIIEKKYDNYVKDLHDLQRSLSSEVWQSCNSGSSQDEIQKIVRYYEDCHDQIAEYLKFYLQ